MIRIMFNHRHSSLYCTVIQYNIIIECIPFQSLSFATFISAPHIALYPSTLNVLHTSIVSSRSLSTMSSLSQLCFLCPTSLLSSSSAPPPSRFILSHNRPRFYLLSYSAPLVITTVVASDTEAPENDNLDAGRLIRIS